MYKKMLQREYTFFIITRYLYYFIDLYTLVNKPKDWRNKI